MRYWIFKCNPDEYCIDERLRDNEPNLTWKVMQHRDEIRNGGVAFIWRTGPERGICAVIQIDSDIREMEEIESERKYLKQPLGPRQRVGAHITERGFAPISHIELKGIQGLESLSVFSRKVWQRATNFTVTDEQGEILLKLVAGRCRGVRT